MSERADETDPESLRGMLDQLESDANRVGASHLVAKLDQLNARLRDERDRRLGLDGKDDQ